MLLVVLLGCAAAAATGTWLGSAPPLPEGTVRLPAGVPDQVRRLRIDDVDGVQMSGTAVVFRPDGLVAYLSSDRRTVGFLDPAAGAPVGSVGLPGTGAEMAAGPDGRTAYVTDPSGVLRIVDLDTRAVVGAVPTGGRPDAVAVSPDGRRVYVGDAGTGAVTVVDPVARRALARWAVGGPAGDLAVGADGTRLLVTRRDADVVTVLDTVSGATVRTAPVPRAPLAGPIAVAAGSDRAWIAAGDGLREVDLATGASSRPDWVAAPVLAVVLSADGRRLYLVTAVDGRADPPPPPALTTVDVIERRVVGRTAVFKVGTAPAATVSPDGHRLLLTTDGWFAGYGQNLIDLR